MGSLVISVIYKNKLTSTQKNLEFSTKVGTIARQYKVLKQVGVVNDIKSQ